jgi:hypothetical protein
MERNMLTSNLRLALAALLSLLLCLEPAFAGVMAMSAPRTPSVGATAYAYPPETGQTLMVFTPFHDVVFDQTVCFNNANDVQDFVGGPGSSQPGTQTSALAQTYFSAGGGGDVNKICFTRISQGGGRTRVIGAVNEWGTQAIAATDTACASGIAYCNLTAIQALNSILSLTISVPGGHTQTISATISGLSGKIWTQIATALQTAINNAAVPFTTSMQGTVGIGSCQVTGYIVAGIMHTLTATNGSGSAGSYNVSGSNCYQVGSELYCGATTSTLFPCLASGGWQWGASGQQTLGQINGTPGGVGDYSVWLENPVQLEALQNNYGSQSSTPYWTAIWGILNITAAGANDSLAEGDQVTASGLGATGVMANIVPGNVTECTGAGCVGTVWSLSVPPASPITTAETITAQPCTIDVSASYYNGAVNNSIRFWYEPSANCSYVPPQQTSFASGPTAEVLGWGADESSSGGYSPVPWPYGGNYHSPSSEVVGIYPNQTGYTAWLNSFVSTNFSDFTVDQFWADPDLGLVLSGTPTPTYKNQVTAWHAGLGDSNIPLSNYIYALSRCQLLHRQWHVNPSSPWPVCVPGATTYTTAGTNTFNPDYCPVHDIYLIGAAGTTAASVKGTGTGTGQGGAGASGGFSSITSMTTDSGIAGCCGPAGPPALTFMVGSPGTTPTNTRGVLGSLIAGGYFQAMTGNNGTAPVVGTSNGISGAAPSQTCAEYVYQGNGVTNCHGGKGGPATATGGVGGLGGSSSATFTTAGFIGGTASGSAAGGGGGTSAAGGNASSTTSGAGGANADGATAGSSQSGTTGAAGNAYGGGGLGRSTSGSVGAGGAGAPGTEFLTLTYCPTSSIGFGGGGGGGGANDYSSGGTAGNGGNGGNYGGSGGGGGGSNSASGTVGSPGTSAGGVVYICARNDH